MLKSNSNMQKFRSIHKNNKKENSCENFNKNYLNIEILLYFNQKCILYIEIKKLKTFYNKIT